VDFAIASGQYVELADIGTNNFEIEKENSYATVEVWSQLK